MHKKFLQTCLMAVLTMTLNGAGVLADNINFSLDKGFASHIAPHWPEGTTLFVTAGATLKSNRPNVLSINFMPEGDDLNSTGDLALNLPHRAGQGQRMLDFSKTLRAWRVMAGDWATIEFSLGEETSNGKVTLTTCSVSATVAEADLDVSAGQWFNKNFHVKMINRASCVTTASTPQFTSNAGKSR
jgi:hypothetical protein